MKKIHKGFLLSVGVFLYSLCCFAQDTLTPKNPYDDRIFTIVEEMPSFPGGEETMMNFIAQNIKYPPRARENNIQGRVYVNFILDTAGTVTRAKVVRGIGGGCDEEAIRVIASMPKWKPGKQNGQPVNVVYNLPVLFGDKGDENKASTNENHYNHGVELLKKEKFIEAIKEFDESIQVNKSDIDAYYNRGIAKLRMNDRSGACFDWSTSAIHGDANVFQQLNRFCDSLIIYEGDTVNTTQPKTIDTIEFVSKTDTGTEVMPHFPGGEKALLEFIFRNVKYPLKAKANGIEGKVYVTFYIDKNGGVGDPKIAKGIGGGCDEEVIKVVKLMPRWVPGKKGGKPVNVRFNLPVNFTVKN